MSHVEDRKHVIVCVPDMVKTPMHVYRKRRIVLIGNS